MADEPLQNICPHCGAPLEQTAKVCSNCGALIEGLWPTEAEEEPAIASSLLPDSTVGYGFGCGCLVSAPFVLAWFLIAFYMTVLEEGNIRGGQRLTAAFVVTFVGWLAIVLTTYLWQRPPHPRFARGFGNSAIALVIFVVTILLSCGGVSR